MKIINRSASAAILILALLGQSCSNHTEVNPSVTRLPVSEADILTKDTFSSFIRIDKTIKLETHPDGLIGLIVKVDITDDYVFILSQGSGVQLALLQFAASGKFIRRLDRTGKGPGEVARLRGFYNDKIDGNIYLIDEGSKGVRMDYNGNLISDCKFPKGAFDMIRLDDRHLAFASAGLNSLYITDLSFNEITHIENAYPSINYERFNPLLRIKNDVLLHLSMNDTLWRVESDTLMPAYFIDYGARSLSLAKFMEFPSGPMGDRNVPDQYMWGTGIRAATDEQLCYFIYYSRRTLLAFTDFKSKLSYVFEYKRIINDPILGKGFYPIGSFEPGYFIGEFMPANMNLDQIPSVLDSALPIAQDDNPILVTFRFIGPGR
jgi:hypothetical protein